MTAARARQSIDPLRELPPHRRVQAHNRSSSAIVTDVSFSAAGKTTTRPFRLRVSRWRSVDRARTRSLAANGTREPYVIIAATTADRTSGYARMVRTGTELVFAWVSTKPTSQIRTAVVQCGNGELV
jgi:hypothetical protein